MVGCLLKEQREANVLQMQKRVKHDENEISRFSPKNVSILLEVNSTFGVRVKNPLTRKRRKAVGKEKREASEMSLFAFSFLSYGVLCGCIRIYK